MSADTLVLMIGDAPCWLRILDGAIVARGDGAFDGEVPGARVVAVVPASDVAIHYADLPDMSDLQAAAAARLIVAEQSAAPADSLHIAIGESDLAGTRPVVAIERTRMDKRLAELAALGLDPDAMIAAPLLLARPDAGFVLGDLGTETVVRGVDRAFADDTVLTPLITSGAVTTLNRARIEADLVAAVANPEVDLRQGSFAKKRDWGIDWLRLRRIGWLALALLVGLLILQLVQIARLNMAASGTETTSAEVARRALPAGTTINSPLIQLRERVAALRGPGGGFLPLATSVAAATNGAPNVELTSMIFDGGGTLRVTARAGNPAELAAFDAALAASGLNVAPGPMLVDQDKKLRDYTVSPK